MTFKDGDKVIVIYPPNYNHKKELECSGEICGKIKDKEKYVMRLHTGQIVYPKTEMIERSLI